MFHGHYAFRNDPVASQSASEAHRKANQSATRVDIISRDVERLLMITEALWQILKEQHGYCDEELMDRVMKIDMRDGKLDGKVAATPSPTCTNCNRPVGKRRFECIYCGTAVNPEPFAR